MIFWLERSGFDFRSETAAAIASFGASRVAEDALIVGMIDRGLPLHKSLKSDARESGILGEQLLASAIGNGLPQTLELLAKSGWLDRLGRERAGLIFADSAAGCSPELVQLAARLNIPLDAKGSITEGDALYNTGDSAIIALSDTYNCEDDEVRRLAVAKSLLVHGANPNRRNVIGETAIFNVENYELLDLLYARGADGSAKDYQGNSAVFSSWTDDIVLRHLEHGASPAGRYYDGKSLREQMLERPMPKVARWLDQHGK